MTNDSTHPVMSLDHLVPIPKAADIIGVHHTTLYRWIRKKQIETVLIGYQEFLHADTVEQLRKENSPEK